MHEILTNCSGQVLTLAWVHNGIVIPFGSLLKKIACYFLLQVGLEISVSRGIEDSSTNILHSKNLDTQELHSTNNPPVHSCLFDLLNLESQNGSNKVC